MNPYEKPFSSRGIEFDPLGVAPDRSGITLHETGFLPANRNWIHPHVFSPYWRLYFNSEQGHYMVFGDRKIELTPRHIALIPPHCRPFGLLGVEPVPHFWFTFSFISRLSHDQEPPVLIEPRDTELCLIRDLQRLVLADTARTPMNVIYRNSMALLQVVLARDELRWQPQAPDNMERARRFIEENFGKKLANPLLAREAGLCVAAFERNFKRHFGKTAARYVTEVRVREAARRLLQTDDGIETIADQTGFPNRAYFSRVFKQVVEESPAGFRRKHRRKDG